MARNGVDLGELLVTWQPAGRRGTAWKPLLHHIAKGQPQARRTVALKVPRKLPHVLMVAEMQVILNPCDRLRDRFLFAVQYETGMRIGEALGLRHEDLAAAEREVAVVPRDNDNGARSKSRAPRSNRLKRIQYRPALIDGFLAQTGLEPDLVTTLCVDDLP